MKSVKSASWSGHDASNVVSNISALSSARTFSSKLISTVSIVPSLSIRLSFVCDSKFTICFEFLDGVVVAVELDSRFITKGYFSECWECVPVAEKLSIESLG